MLPLFYRSRVRKVLVFAALALIAAVASLVFSPGGMAPAYAHSRDAGPPLCLAVSVSVLGESQPAAPTQGGIVCPGNPDQGMPPNQIPSRVQLGCFRRFAVPVKGLAGFVYPLQILRQCLLAKGEVVLLENYMPSDTLGCLVPFRLGVVMIAGYVFPVQAGQQNTMCLAAKGKLVRLQPTPPPTGTNGDTTDGFVHPNAP